MGTWFSGLYPGGKSIDTDTGSATLRGENDSKISMRAKPKSPVSPFTRRHGRLGAVLAESLPSFSLDVVGVVVDYGREPRLVHSFRAGGQFIAVDSAQQVYVSNQTTVSVFSFDGTRLRSLEGVSVPAGVVADLKNDEIFVVDCRLQQVRAYSLSGALLRTFSACEAGAPVATFGSCCGVAIDDNKGRLFIADQTTPAIQVLTTAGVWERKIRTIAPRTIAVSDTVVAFTCISSDSIHILPLVDGAKDGASSSARNFGGRGSRPGEFAYARGLAFDRENNLIVCDLMNDRLQTFSTEGAFLRELDSAQTGHPSLITKPYAVCVDAEGLLYVLTNNHVCIFAC